MKSTPIKALILGFTCLLIGSLVFAADQPDRGEGRGEGRGDDKPERPQAIVPGSPHRAPELMGLPHINLSNRQKEEIEEIVKNNQEGVVEVNKAVRAAEKALAEAKKAGRPKLIELAAFELGQAIGDRTLLNVAIVKTIKDVLNERQLEALEEFNAKTQRWLRQGKLSAPERSGEGDRDTEEDRDQREDRDRPNN